MFHSEKSSNLPDIQWITVKENQQDFYFSVITTGETFSFVRRQTHATSKHLNRPSCGILSRKGLTMRFSCVIVLAQKMHNFEQIVGSSLDSRGLWIFTVPGELLNRSEHADIYITCSICGKAFLEGVSSVALLNQHEVAWRVPSGKTHWDVFSRQHRLHTDLVVWVWRIRKPASEGNPSLPSLGTTNTRKTHNALETEQRRRTKSRLARVCEACRLFGRCCRQINGHQQCICTMHRSVDSTVQTLAHWPHKVENVHVSTLLHSGEIYAWSLIFHSGFL